MPTYYFDSDFAKQDNPVRAKARVVLADLNNPSDRMPCLFNPQQWQLSCSVDIGKLRPVGSSHPTKMYGSTGEWAFPLSLYFSQFAIWHFGYKYPDIQSAMRWLARFVMPQAPGIAPMVMLVVAPNILERAGAVEGINIGMTSFDSDLKVRTAEVQLQMAEIRQEFLTARVLGGMGFDTSDEGHTLAGAVRSGFRLGSTGPSLNLSRSGGPKR